MILYNTKYNTNKSKSPECPLKRAKKRSARRGSNPILKN
nr:MAG TPA: hypothetical protein [Caudoviricetes sp.]